MNTPEWLAPASISSRIGVSPLANAQAGVVTALLEPRRLDRMAMSEQMGGGYAPADYLADLRRVVWSGARPDANLRAMQRVYMDRLGALVAPPATPPAAAGAQGGGEGGPSAPPSPLLAPLNVPRGDLPALARNELRVIRADAQRNAASAPAGVQRAHWADVVARADAILEPNGR